MVQYESPDTGLSESGDWHTIKRFYSAFLMEFKIS